MSGTIAFNNATLIAPQHPLNGKMISIKCGQGKILELATTPLLADQVWDVKGALLTGGWFDVYAVVPDPGAHWKESLESFIQTAWESGFTHAAVMAGIDPLPDKASALTAIISRSKNSPVKIWPLAAASENFDGKEMAEVFELHEAGALAQTDGIKAHATDSLRAKIFEYCHALNIPYWVHPFNPKWAPGGQIHEGEVCVNLGLKGIPEIAETSALLADIELAKWLNIPLKVLGISSNRSLEIIRNARSEGVKIEVAVALMNLLYSEHDVQDFDERFKVLPPLRTEQDKIALRTALWNGEIQAIFSNHCPQDVESQKVEFDYAEFGAATLPGFVQRLFDFFDDPQLESVLGVLGEGNRTFLGLNVVQFEPGSIADFCIVDRNIAISHRNSSSSKAYNQLPESSNKKGCLVAIVHGEHQWINNELK